MDNENLLIKQKLLNELIELDKLKNKDTRLVSLNGAFGVTELDGEIEWNTDRKLLSKYVALKHKALLIKLKAVDQRVKHLNKELKKG